MSKTSRSKQVRIGTNGFTIVLMCCACLLFMPAEILAGESNSNNFPNTLNTAQQAYMEWTEKEFGAYLDKSRYVKSRDNGQEDMEKKWIDTLKKSLSRDYYEAINGLAAIESKEATEVLLKVATERREKDNRDRWMATRALGLVADESVVPELIPLVYHYNQNTRFWAQISLVRLTDKNFATDWKKWATWWNQQNKGPKAMPQKITWTTRSEWADPARQAESDRRFAQSHSAKTEMPATTTASANNSALRAALQAKIRQVLLERKTYLERIAKEKEIALKLGRGTLRDYKQARVAALLAGIDLCDTKAERIEIRRENLKLLTDIEKSMEREYRTGHLPEGALHQHRIARMEAEINLLKEQLEVKQ